MGLLSTIGSASGRAFGFTRSAIAAATDAFFNRVTLLLNTGSTNGAQNNTFLDSSSNNFSITRNGNTTQGTFTPFSQTGWSNYFDGTGDYLTAPSSTAFGPGTGDFTIEFWLYATVFTDSFGVCQFGTAGTNWEISSFTNNLSFWRSGSGSSSFGANPTVNAWDHFAMSRSGTTLYFYKNGVRTNSATSFTSDIGTTNAFSIGLTTAFTKTTTGYISNFRYIKGTALYTGTTLTVPTAPLTAITNTQLLTCQSNRFIDNSTNAFALTPNGNVAVQAFSPFAPTAAYSTTTVGGSGYFDGTGDYLTVPNSTNYSLTSDYTIEAFVYPSVTGGNARIFMMGDYRSTFNGIDIYTNASNQVVFYSNGASVITGGTLNPFSWNHVALVRSGSGTNNTTLYLNGVSIGQATNTTSFVGVAGNGISLGLEYSGAGTSVTTACYLSNIRVTKGQALTSGAFTQPTAPVTTASVGWTGANAATTLTGTVQLLTNFTNAGIFDSTAKNVLETVGNAQVSTTQAKFGTTSMYFDGTGDYLFFRPNTLYDFGTGDFTMECWFYPTTTSGTVGLMSTGNNTGFGCVWLMRDTTSISLRATSSNTAEDVRITGGTVAANNWYHAAAVRSGTTFSLYLNGTRVATTTNSTALKTNCALAIGAFYDTTITGTYTGYIDEPRISKGYARYSGTSFSVPTDAFPTQ